MKFYKFVKDGVLLGLLQTATPPASPYATMITQEEYTSLGGSVLREGEQSKSPVDALAEENKILRVKLQLQEEQLALFGDCLAEVAALVYP